MNLAIFLSLKSCNENLVLKFRIIILKIVVSIHQCIFFSVHFNDHFVSVGDFGRRNQVKISMV